MSDLRDEMTLEDQVVYWKERADIELAELKIANKRIAALEAERDAHQKMGAAAILRNVEMGKILTECYDWMANNGGPGRLLRQADAALAREVPAPPAHPHSDIVWPMHERPNKPSVAGENDEHREIRP